MKKLLLSLFLAITAISAISQGFYDINTINTIEITFTEPGWDQILDTYYVNDIGERLTATVIINGTQYDSVGVKYKGNSSCDTSRIKNPFNIKLDHVIDGQDIEGYSTLKLSNGWRDPSFVREPLAYEIARKYTTASQANFVRVYVNGTYWGLYISVESVNKDFIENHYYEDAGAFLKG
ncbi:unnamed protein product, partial [marine sediment metagenome]